MLSGDPIDLSELLRLYFPQRQPADISAAQAAIVEFYLRGAKPSAAEKERDRPVFYSFLADAEALIAEFQRVYGLDLTRVKMHWWRFSALLDGLISHSFSERVKYRTADPSGIKNKDVRAQWTSLKEKYALDGQGQPVRYPQTAEELEEMLLAQARGEKWQVTKHGNEG